MASLNAPSNWPTSPGCSGRRHPRGRGGSPIQFLSPLGGAEIDRKSGLDLFDAFGLKEKTLRANPGGHRQVTVSAYTP